MRSFLSVLGFKRRVPQAVDNLGPRGRARVPSYRALEPRIAFDAAAVATAASIAQQQSDQDHASQSDAAHATTSAPDLQRLAAGLPDAPFMTAAAPTDVTAHVVLAPPPAAVTVSREIIFVDGNVDNRDQLISELGSGLEVIVLDSLRDGVDQIAAALSGRTNISAIHILSHGEQGALHLGTATLNAESMQGQYLDELTTIRSALSSDADILVYGCDFASGDKGLESAALLSSLTGADVAASENATGALNLGGDWILEDHVGSIEAHSLAASNWNALLAPSTAVLDWQIVGNHAIGAAGTTYSIGNLTNAVTIITTGTGTITNDSNFATSGTGDVGLELRANTTSTTVGQTTEILFNSGAFPLGVITASFDLRNIDAGTWDDRVIIQAYDTNGVLLAGTDITATPLQVLNQTYTITSLANGKQFDGNIDGASDDAPYDTARLSITSSTGAGVGRVTVLFVSGTAGTQTGRVVLSDITMLYNQAPTAMADGFATTHDTAVTINVRQNDTDPNADTLTVTRVNGTAIGSGVAVTGGVVTLVAGNLVFTPTANYIGAPSFTYTVDDGRGGTSTATVTGAVTNTAPVADLNSVGSTSSTGPSVSSATSTANLVANGTFADNSATPASWTEGGTIGTGATGRYIWTAGAQTLSQNLTVPSATSSTSSATIGATTTTTTVETERSNHVAFVRFGLAKRGQHDARHNTNDCHIWRCRVRDI